jgi:hypothetical protein
MSRITYHCDIISSVQGYIYFENVWQYHYNTSIMAAASVSKTE